jgi:UDP-N-acetylmuramoyl-L-alanyl-D-glutamate--2,6-diaminopimelate ligase
MEISSHALVQHRVDGLTVDVAGFTNLSRDHLDYHHSMAEYFAAKSILFGPRYAHRAVICVDDDWGRRLARRTRQAGVPVVTVATVPSEVPQGAVPGEAHWQVESTSPGRTGATVAQLRAPSGACVTLPVPLPGDFNVANAVLAAAMLVEATDVDPARAAAAVAAAGPVPGRMERIEAGTAAAGAPLAVVDYAHTPDAVALALASLRAAAKPLVVVLGAGGDRDRDKRPLMGAAAAAVADIVVVTDDNPRSEDPAAIRAAVLAGARQRAGTSGAQIREISGRREAIAAAVTAAWTDAGTGVVLVAGKGHEQGQEIVTEGLCQVQPFDDRQVLREVLEHAR